VELGCQICSTKHENLFVHNFLLSRSPLMPSQAIFQLYELFSIRNLSTQPITTRTQTVVTGTSWAVDIDQLPQLPQWDVCAFILPTQKPVRPWLYQPDQCHRPCTKMSTLNKYKTSGYVHIKIKKLHR